MVKAPADIVGAFRTARALVIGDVMLDRFVYAKVSRISPEAPVPVLAVERETAMLGGAGNVARNIASLGGRATLFGIKGADRAGDIMDDLVARTARMENALLTVGNCQTVEKIRYVGDQQQVMRADYELLRPRMGGAEMKKVLTRIRDIIADHDVIVISDYAKGQITPGLVQELIAMARAKGKPVIVDPKGTRLRQYDGATVITPNTLEVTKATNQEAESDQEVSLCAQALLEQLPNLGAVLVTRGASGMSLAPRGGTIEHIAARQREVFDVSGAGDTVVATLALALGCGSDLSTAARLSNIAAGVAVGMMGTAAVTADDITAAIHAQQIESVEKKIVSLDRAADWAQIWRGKGRRIGFTNGCFDLVHPGHISLLSQARSNCDRLIVGLNSDASVKRLKGAGRPIQDEMARAIVLASLGMIDLVVIFGEDTPENVIKRLAPDVLVKGADYRIEQIVGADFVQSYGGEVVMAGLVPGRSTTSILTRFPGSQTAQ